MITATTDRIAAALAQLEPLPPPQQDPQPPTEAAAVLAAQLEAAQADFGNLIHRWQLANGWSQDDPKRIAVAAGFADFAVHNSQWSKLVHVDLLPKPKLFAALAVLNRLVADQSWAAIAQRGDRRVKQALQSARPLLRTDGTPWTAADFFDAYIGGC